MILGYQHVVENLEKMSQTDMRNQVQESISLVQEYAKNECPVHDGELRESIYTAVEDTATGVRGTCYTNKNHGPFVEFGTGPSGMENHEGISPEVAVAYTTSPWWIHESQIDAAVAEKYHFFYIDTPNGRFYQCVGQAAQPFLYPALKNNEEKIVEKLTNPVRRNL